MAFLYLLIVNVFSELKDDADQFARPFLRKSDSTKDKVKTIVTIVTVFFTGLRSTEAVNLMSQTSFNIFSMNKYINLFSTIGLIFTLNCVLGQEKILKLTENEKYEMFFVNASLGVGLPTDSIQDTFIIKWDKDVSFLMDDPKAIRMLENNWVGERVQHSYPGFMEDYIIYILVDGVIIDELSVFDRIKKVITKHGDYDYSDSALLGQLDKSKGIAVAEIEFESVEIGRNFINDVVKNEDLYAPGVENMDWYKYGGNMILKTKRIRNTDKLETRIADAITEKFPNEPFEVSFLGCSDRDCLFTVYCSELVGSRLGEFETVKKWNHFPPIARLISKTDRAIRELVMKYAR